MKNRFINQNLLSSIKEKINANEIFPHRENILNCFNYFNFSETKVVFMGLSPYKKPWANGLCFGTDGRSQPSLEMLLDCLANDINFPFVEHKFDYSLEHWAKQKVLLYNVALTVPKIGIATAHLNHWSEFTIDLIKRLSNELDNIIFVAFGNDAHHYTNFIDNKKHYIKKVCHPAATYYRRFDEDIPLKYDITKSGIFNWVNEKLEFLEKEKINWIKL